MGEQFHVATRELARPEPEGAHTSHTTSAVEAVGHTAGPEVVNLLELLGFCGSKGMGKTELGQVLIPEAFLREITTACAEPRSLSSARTMQIICKAGALRVSR